MERQMTAVDVQAYLRDVKDRIMDARVIALVEEDLEHGLMPGEINDYTDRGLSFEQMKAVSDMYRNKIPMAVVASIGAKKYDAEKMRVATELYLKQIPVEDIEKGAIRIVEMEWATVQVERANLALERSKELLGNAIEYIKESVNSEDLNHVLKICIGMTDEEINSLNEEVTEEQNEGMNLS